MTIRNKYLNDLLVHVYHRLNPIFLQPNVFSGLSAFKEKKHKHTQIMFFHFCFEQALWSVFCLECSCCIAVYSTSFAPDPLFAAVLCYLWLMQVV